MMVYVVLIFPGSGRCYKAHRLFCFYPLLINVLTLFLLVLYTYNCYPNDKLYLSYTKDMFIHLIHRADCFHESRLVPNSHAMLNQAMLTIILIYIYILIYIFTTNTY